MAVISTAPGSAYARLVRYLPFAAKVLKPLIEAVEALQGVLSAAPSVASIATLKAVSAVDRADKQVRLVADNGLGYADLYRFVAASSTTESLPYVVQPTAGTGRWFAIGLKDLKTKFDATYVTSAKLATKTVTIALGDATGSAEADATWIGATLLSCSAVSGNDQAPASFSVNGSGVVTVTVADDETAESTFTVLALLA